MGTRHRLHEIIFEAETPAGKTFDVALLLAILASVAAVMLESVASIRAQHGALLRQIEWGFTILFTIEYFARLYCVLRPARYALSFFGVVDLLSILPTYLSLVFVGTQSLLVIRALRLLRVFRVLKLVGLLAESRMLVVAMRASWRKITVFLGGVLVLMLILGTLMYLIEGEERGFTSVPQGVYWAIVTMTTVGYGDLAPETTLGRMLASVAMILGYGIIAVPTGIVTVEMAAARRASANTEACPSCSFADHDDDARFCKKCGAKL